MNKAMRGLQEDAFSTAKDRRVLAIQRRKENYMFPEEEFEEQFVRRHTRKHRKPHTWVVVNGRAVYTAEGKINPRLLMGVKPLRKLVHKRGFKGPAR